MKATSRYKKRYRYSGDLNFNFSNNQVGERGGADFFQSKDFSVQLKILKDQDKKLALEEKNLALRRKYIKWKLKYYNMLSAWDEVSCEEMEKIREQISEVSKKMRFWDKK